MSLSAGIDQDLGFFIAGSVYTFLLSSHSVATLCGPFSTARNGVSEMVVAMFSLQLYIGHLCHSQVRFTLELLLRIAVHGITVFIGPEPRHRVVLRFGTPKRYP